MSIEADVAEGRDPASYRIGEGMDDLVSVPARTDDLAERVVAAMREHGSPSYPRAFEVWYAHLSGEMPAVSTAMNAIIASDGQVAAADIDSLYERFISSERFSRQAERTSLQVLSEIDALGVPDSERSEPQLTDATAAFDALMREALHSRSYAQVLAVLLVAEWLYLDWATRPDAGDAGRPEHLGWIDLHRGAAFNTWVDWLRAQLDAHEPADDGERRAVESIFARAVRCELAFFDAAYHD